MSAAVALMDDTELSGVEELSKKLDRLREMKFKIGVRPVSKHLDLALTSNMRKPGEGSPNTLSFFIGLIFK